MVLDVYYYILQNIFRLACLCILFYALKKFVKILETLGELSTTRLYGIVVVWIFMCVSRAIIYGFDLFGKIELFYQVDAILPLIDLAMQILVAYLITLLNDPEIQDFCVVSES